MSLGLPDKQVLVVPYDPAWPTLFVAERDRLTAALAGLPMQVEHMGSTAVPGLAAKPILDLLAGYPAGADVAPYIEAMVRAGYVHRGPQGIPGREFFRRGQPRAYHLHMAEAGGDFWRAHLAFRDALRAAPALRDAYAALKHELAARYPNDRPSYIDGKTEFVLQVVQSVLQPSHSLQQPAQQSVQYTGAS
jgi:GrpB-like predicted nucleotidyltransferase (UPF0157 family)